MTPPAAVRSRPLAAVSTRPLAAVLPLLAALLLLALLPGALLPDSAAAATVPAPAGSSGLTLQLTRMTPRVVTADGPTTVTVLGTLRNTGDRPVGELEVRLQRGDALRTDGEVRDALAGTARMDTVAPEFTSLPGVLDPGAALPVTLTVPLRGAPQDGLALTRPGVYPTLVNVNGVPRGGVRARLVAVRMLLPVLALPPGPGPQAAPAVPAPAVPAADVTVLYPLADVPHRLPTVPGEPTQLADDDLARSLAPDGRLGGLLTTYADRAPPGSQVRAATCLAVDPDLLATAAAMRQGYLVRAPDGTTTPGAGAQVATTWLTTLAATARGGCVVALPFADADLVALTRGSLGDLAQLAVSGAGAAVSTILGTPVLDATTWPAGGVLDEPALGAVTAAGTHAVVLTADAVDTVDGTPASATAGVVTLPGPGPSAPVAVLTDPLLSRAATEDGTPDGGAPDLVADGTRPDRGIPVGVLSSTDAGGSPALSTQDGLAALVFRTQSAPPAGGPIVVAPPHLWATDGTGAQALLDGVDQLVGAGRLTPLGLADVVAAGPATTGTARPADPLQVDAPDLPQPVMETVRQMRADVVDLQAAAVPETGVGASLDATFTPLRQAVLRPASAAWRGRPDLAGGAAAAAASRIEQLRDSVRVLPPPTPFSLGTSNAPLLLTVANGLPVTMEVRLSISSTTGLRVAPIPAQRIPPLGRRQVQVDAQVVRSGQFVVEAMVRTATGRQLGPPSRLQVRSTAYGTITVWLTGCASVLLVVLAARRVVRRIRGESGRGDRVDPPAGPAPETRDPVGTPGRGPAPGPPRPPPPPATPKSPMARPSQATRASKATPPAPAVPAEPTTSPVVTDPEAPTRPVPASTVAAPPVKAAPVKAAPVKAPPVPVRQEPEPPTRPVPARRR